MKLIINSTSMVPIYEQIVEQIRTRILQGELLPDTMLPSVRSLASELKISALTVKKAYDHLEEEGLISNQYSFIIQAIIYDYEIQPGDYVLNTSMTSRDILDELSTLPEEEESQ